MKRVGEREKERERERERLRVGRKEDVLSSPYRYLEKVECGEEFARGEIADADQEEQCPYCQVD